MGDLPRITVAVPQALTLRVQSSWPDHHFQGKPVLPAVEAMQILAARIRADRPALDVHAISNARFPKFLAIAPDRDSVETRFETTDQADGAVQAALTGNVTVGTARIRRSVTHADLCFGGTVAPLPCMPLDLLAGMEGICTNVDPEVIYRELVPFGPGFRSICRPLAISADGALAQVRAPAHTGAYPGPLGSGFPLDGAFHAACVWGQRFARRVAFPVAIARRRILFPTRSDATYTARVVPVTVDASQLIVDIWILDDAGNLCEAVLGVVMRDVSRGAWQPPDWIVEDQPDIDPGAWAGSCLGIVIMERDHLANFAAAALTSAETQRLAAMGNRRQTGYIAGRLALKRLWRKLADNDHRRSSTAIETVVDGESRPCLPAVDNAPPMYAALSHDHRFCVAVAHDTPVGIDVEPTSARALRAQHLFMDASEQELVKVVAMGNAEAALRVWSIKEAAAKALDMALIDTWEHIRVTRIGEEESRFEYDGWKTTTARHMSVAGHLITLVTDAGSGRIRGGG